MIDAPAPRSRPAMGARGLALPTALLAAGACGAAYLYAVDPNQSGGYPPCVFLSVTGLWCPGCGAARALHAMTHLDFATALARNPYAVAVVFYIAWEFIRWTQSRVTGTPRTLAPAWIVKTVAVSIVLFWVLRNVPGMTWLSPL